jgi:hypothetical protein
LISCLKFELDYLPCFWFNELLHKYSLFNWFLSKL